MPVDEDSSAMNSRSRVAARGLFGFALFLIAATLSVEVLSPCIWRHPNPSAVNLDRGAKLSPDADSPSMALCPAPQELRTLIRGGMGGGVLSWWGFVLLQIFCRRNGR